MPPTTSASITRQHIRQALKRWHQAPALGQLPLAELQCTTAVRQQHQYADSPAGRGVALRRLLQDQLDALKPHDTAPDYSDRNWRIYYILQAQFVDQRAAQDIRDELGISESGYFNDQRQGLDWLAQRLQEQEMKAVAAEQPDAVVVTTPNATSAPQLPHAPVAFIGRQQERAQLAELLAQADAQLITLVGTGGMGKTRLAIQAAQDYYEATGDAVYFVPLETADTADLLVPTIAQAIQLNFDTQGNPQQQLLNFLRGRALLLVLDNMEHLLPAGAEFLPEMLTAAPHLRVIVTSRERLHLRGEWVLELTGLEVPPPEAETKTTVMALGERYSAVQLFLTALARGRGQGELVTTDDERTAVAEICRLVSGMPLALELAASWGNMLSCADIATEIRASLDFLAGTYRDLPLRHQSLRAVFEHSWRLLTPIEQANFRQLAVLRGSFSREAAASIVGARLPTLHALASKSLLQVTAHKRYVVHPLLRQFAAEQLQAQPGEQNTVQTAHSRYYLNWVAAHTAGLKQGHRQTETMAAFLAELENIRAAWHTAVWQKAWGLLLDAAVGLSYFYHNTNRFQEGLEVLTSTAVALIQSDATNEAQQLRGLILGLQGRIHHVLGQREAAQSTFQRSLPLLLTHGTDEQTALIRLFAIEANLPDDGWQPQALYKTCLAYFAGADDEWGMAYCHVKYVSHLRLSGIVVEPEYQRRLLEESLRLREKIGDQRGVASSLSLLGDLAYERGDYAEARQCALRSLTLYDELGDNLGRALALNHLGQVAGSKGEYGEAKRYYEESLALLRAHGNPREISVCLDCVGYITYLLQDLDTAEVHYQESLELSQEMGDVAGTAWSLHNLGDIARARQDFATARELYEQSYQLHTTIDVLSWGGAVALDKLGRVRLALDDIATAEADFRLALDIAHKTERYREMLDALLNLARVALAKGDADRARELLAVVVNHPATARETYDTAVGLLAERPVPEPPPLAEVVQSLLA